MNIKFRVTLPEEAVSALERNAKAKGVSANILARILLCEHLMTSVLDSADKEYTITLKNWREVEAYVEVKNLGSVEDFAEKSVGAVMRRNALTTPQKAEFERLLEK
jgi:hypothetical protein